MPHLNIGLLGGTFNPIHRGHIELGLQVKESFGLDQVLFILSAQPPHKRSRKIADADVRWRMLQVALAPHPGLVPCDLEIRRPEPSWTIATVEELKRRQPGDTFYFISGSEGFLKIRTWKEYRRLLLLLFFIIVLRRAAHLAPLTRILNEEGIPLQARLQPGAVPPGAFIHRYPSPYLSLSSTRVRRLRRQQQSLSGLVDPRVHKLMEEYRLYENR